MTDNETQTETQPEQQQDGQQDDSTIDSGVSQNPNQGTDDDVDKTRYETVDTNAGPDAHDGGIAEAEPTDIGDQKPMDETG